jgi:AraC family transcriptional regulator
MELKLPGGQFCGDVLRSSNLSGIRLTETTYSPGLVLPKHSHEHACFIFTLGGSFYETYGKRSRVCKSLTLIYRPSDEVHSDHFYNSGGRCLNIEIEPQWMELIRRPPISLDGSAAFEGGAVAGLAIKLYKEFQQPDDVSPIAIEGLFLEIIAEVARHNLKLTSGGVPKWLERARQFLQDHFCDCFTVDELARVVDVHPAHLIRSFRRHYGCTIGEYTRRLRIDFACRELSVSDAALAEIASTSGFYDQAHFSRTFKRLTGTTPTKFRELTRLRKSCTNRSE